MMKETRKTPSLGFALIVFLAVIAVMVSGLVLFKGKLSLVLLLSWFVVAIAASFLGYKFTDMEKMAYDSIRGGLAPMMIVLIVGIMVGAWIQAGTIPSLIYYGIKIISPNYFYIASFLLCSLMSLFTGTSWGTMGSAGIALIGIGQAMGMNMGCVAAAIITGAYFGDKLSPLSDTTVLAATVANGYVMNHIKHMLWTTSPAYIISAVIYLVMGLKDSGKVMDASAIDGILNGLQANFNIGFLPILPALLVLVLLLMNKHPLASLGSAAALAAVIAIFYQGVTVNEVLSVLSSGFKIDSGIAEIDKILNKGGLASMWDTMGVFIFALGLSGMLRETGILNVLLAPVQAKANTPRRIIFLTMVVAYIANAVGCSLLFAISITGTLMMPLYKEKRLRPENLSRTLEDSATMTAALIPWNTGAIYAVSTLGVAFAEYAPFCFLFFLTPVFTIIYALTGRTICYLDEDEEYGPDKAYKSRFNPSKSVSK